MNCPEVLHAALDKMAIAIGEYACYQIESGAQAVQFFESWAHHLGPGQFATFAKPYADRAMQYVRDRHPGVPLVYYANGGSPYLDLQKDMAADAIPTCPSCTTPTAARPTSTCKRTWPPTPSRRAHRVLRQRRLALPRPAKGHGR